MPQPTTRPAFAPAFSAPWARRALPGWLVAGALAFGAGCTEGGSSTPGAAGDPIAVVGSRTITVEEVQKRLDEQSPFVRARYADAEKKRELLESQVRFEVLAAEAYARGLDKDPEVQDAHKKILVQKLTREEFDGRVKPEDITEEELRAHYEKNQADYHRPQTVRASHIAIAIKGADAASESVARKTAEVALVKAADPQKKKDRNHFKEVVAAYTTDERTKPTGGDLRYLTAVEAEQRFGAEARDWLFSAPTVDEVSGVIRGRDAFHIFKRTGHRPEVTRSFEEVKGQIKNALFRDKRSAAFDALIASLKDKHGVKVYEDKLDRVKVNAQPQPAPPSGPTIDPHAGHGHGHDDDDHLESGSDDEGER